MKTCSKCNTEKNKSEFYTKGTKLQTYCKTCFNAYCIERWIQRKKDAIIYLGSKCNHCNNEYHYAAMQFHHTNPSQKDFDWGKLRLRSQSSINEELDKCILLCANCHSILHSNE
jgi:hypothetical protein